MTKDVAVKIVKLKRTMQKCAARADRLSHENKITVNQYDDLQYLSGLTYEMLEKFSHVFAEAEDKCRLSLGVKKRQ